VVLLVGPNADRHAEQRIHRLRPERVDLEDRRLHHVALRLGHVLHQHLPDTECGDAGRERTPRDDSLCLFPFHAEKPP
jgi:hypothetical protein